MTQDNPSSGQLRREAEELRETAKRLIRETAKRLIKEAANLLDRSIELEKKISRNGVKPGQ